MERVFAALARIVWQIDNPDSLTDYLSQLGRGHRKFGVRERHYEPFLAVLAETVRHFNGHNWTARTQAAWDTALGRVSAGMLAAAEQDAALQPPWWVAEVVQHDQRRPDLAVLTIKPDQPLHYTPGQYIAVQVPRWPRVWRNFSIANAPRENGLIDLHVRGLCGGLVSGSLVHNTRPGDTLLLGQACGEMTASADQDTGLLCIAGGTGLAPIKAIIEAIIRTPAPGQRREIVLYYGGRRRQDLYDLADLRQIEVAYPWLRIIPAVSDEAVPDEMAADVMHGTVPELAATSTWFDRDVYVSGPDAMIRRTVRVLDDLGAPRHLVRYDLG